MIMIVQKKANYTLVVPEFDDVTENVVKFRLFLQVCNLYFLTIFTYPFSYNLPKNIMFTFEKLKEIDKNKSSLTWCIKLHRVPVFDDSFRLG